MKVSDKTRKKRRKRTAEVFTPPKLVQEILDKLPDRAWLEDKTFCDPAAGNGNFLVEVYRYKVEKHGHDPEKALSTIYGVELMPDNVAELKLRLVEMAEKYSVDGDSIIEIVSRNIVCADALEYDFEFRPN